MKSNSSNMATAKTKPKLLSAGDVDSRVARRRSSYIEILGSIACELDMMLSDLCEVFPEPNHDATKTSSPVSPSGKKRQISDDVFDYISCASDDEVVNDVEEEENGGVGDIDDIPVFKKSSPSISSMVAMQMSDAARDIDLIDRLIRTHPVWYQPTTHSMAAIHMLHGQRLGSFIVHQSKEPDCMTLAVRILENTLPIVKNFTIKNTTAGVQLMGCAQVFDTVPKLIAHLCEYQENLPMALVLPKAISYAQSVQELSALGLLGPDFWTSLMNRSATLSALDMSKLSVNHHSNSYRTEMLVPVSETNESNSDDDDDDDEKIYDSDVVGSTSKIQDPFTEKVMLPKRSLTLPAGQMKFMNPAFFSQFPEAASPPEISVQRPSSLDLSSPKRPAKLTEDKSKRFPAPKGAPPPPPSNQVPAMCTQRILRDEKGRIPERFSGDYYKPYEVTRQDHIPPSSFEIYMNRLPTTMPPSNSTPPPLPPKRKSAIVSSSMKQSVDPYAAPVISIEPNPWAPQPSSDPYSSVSPLSGTPTPTARQKYTWNSGRNSLSSENSGSSQTSRNTVCSEYSTTSSRTSGAFSSDISTISAGSATSGVSSLLDNISDTSYNSNRTSIVSTTSDTPTLANQGESSNRFSLLDIQIPSVCTLNVDILQPVRTPSPSSSPRNSNHISSLSAFDPLSAPNSSGLLGNGESKSVPRSNWETFHQSVRLDKNALESLRTSSTCATRDSGSSTAFTSSSSSFSPVRESVGSSILSRDSVFTDIQDDDIPTTLDDINVPHQRQRLSALTRNSSQVSGASSGTVFSSPWDSSLWEDIMNLGGTKHQPNYPTSNESSSSALPEIKEDVAEKTSRKNSRGRSLKKGDSPKSTLKKNNDGLMTSRFYLDDDHTTLLSSEEKENETQKVSSPRRLSSGFGYMKQRFKPLLVSPMKRRKQDPSRKIQQLIIKMSTNMNSTFGSSVNNFLQCTKEGQETNPSVVMRNTRQFMDGIKHYLLQEDFQFQANLNKEKAKFSSEEPMNEDAIIEGALHKCVIKPLKSFIYKCLLTEYSRNGSIQLLNRNLKTARTKTAEELGVRPVFIPPQGASMQVLQHFFSKMYKAYSPLSMMDCLLKAVQTIYKSTQDTRPGHEAVHSMGADDFLPVFIYVLANCDAQTAEIDSDYMWGLLDPSLMLGQPGYYLTTLSSAVHVIKNLHLDDSSSEDNGIRLPCISDMQGFMKITLHDESNDAMMSKTLPITPTMTTADVCQVIAGKLDVKNSQDYALYLVVDEEERELNPTEIPQQLKANLHAKEKPYIFGYRKKSAKVVWPTPM
ncbi:uncharacterized protein LOC144452016 [Glandiceps talaboti]